MNDVELAALKRKHAATEEVAKKSELAHQLRAAGFDPDTGEAVKVAPEGRTGPRTITTKQEAPADAKKAPADSTDKSKASAPASSGGAARPARPAATKKN